MNPISSTSGTFSAARLGGRITATVVFEPRPGAPSGGIFLTRESCLAGALPAAASPGSETRPFRPFGSGEVDDLAPDAGSAVHDLRTPTGFGVMIGGEGLEEPAFSGCQRSSTEDFFAGEGRGLS